MRLHPTVLVFALAAPALSACAKPATVAPSRSGRSRALVQSLLDPKTRDAASCDLLGLRLAHRLADAYTDTCSPVTEVLTAPQAAGPPLYIVLTNPGYEIEREPLRRGPAGPFTIFDRNGYMVPVFWSANSVDNESEVFAYSPGGQIAIGNVIGVSHGSSFDVGHWSVQTLHIVPTIISQKPALSVVLGPPTFGSRTAAPGASGRGATAISMQMVGRRSRSGPEWTRKGTSRRWRLSAGRASMQSTSAQVEASPTSSSSSSPLIAKPSMPTPRRGGAGRRNAPVTACPGVDQVQVSPSDR
jgi:hypothetical protein